MAFRKVLLFAGASLACSVHLKNSSIPVPPAAPERLNCRPAGSVIEDPGAVEGINFSGHWVFTDYTGDVQGLYEAIGVPAVLRGIPPLYDYGVGMIKDIVKHEGNSIEIASKLEIGDFPPIYGKESYDVGVERITDYGFHLCGEWVQDHTAVVMDAHLLEQQPGLSITLPRSFRYLDGETTVLMAQIKGIVATMRYERRRNVREPAKEPDEAPPSPGDDLITARQRKPTMIRTEHRLAFQQLMAMGALPPFIPMRIVNTR